MNDKELIAVTTKVVRSSYNLRGGQWTTRSLFLSTEESFERMDVGAAHPTQNRTKYRVCRSGPFNSECCLMETESPLTADGFIKALARNMDGFIIDVCVTTRSYIRVSDDHALTTNPLVG